MNQFLKKTLFGIGLLGSLCMVGCKTELTTKGNYLLCNETSHGRMAEIEDGYFVLLNQILYYADKTNLENWVPVCNKPNCMHEDMGCNASLVEYGITNIGQKDGKLYAMVAENEDENPYIFEITLDGSGIKKVYEIPVEEEALLTNSIAGKQVIFQNEFFLSYSFLDEKGITQKRVLRLDENENGTVEITNVYSGTDSFSLLSGNDCWGIRGDNLLINTLFLEEGDTLFDPLCLVNNDNEMKPFIVPDDINIENGYLDGDILTYYQQKEGFYQYNIRTGEKELILKNQLEDGIGCILSEDYFVEWNHYTSFNGSYVPEKAYLKVYNGEAWIDLEMPEEVVNSNAPFFPACIASDRIIFRCNGDDVSYLYYMMLEEENPKLIFAGKIGDGTLENIDSEETSSEQESETDSSSNFEDVVVFESEDYLFKVTDVYINSSNRCCVEMYLENKSDDEKYKVLAPYWTINGIQCVTYWGTVEYVLPGKSLTTTLILTDAVIKSSRIPEFYAPNEYTNIEIGFHLSNSSFEDLESTIIHLYPQGEENAFVYTREPQDTDMVLIENEQVSVILMEYDKCIVPNDTMNVLIKNKTDHVIVVKAYDIFGNGISAKEVENIRCGGYYVSINPGAVALYPMTLFDNTSPEGAYMPPPMSDFFDASGITTIEEIKMTLEIAPYIDVAAVKVGEAFVKETFVLTP